MICPTCGKETKGQFCPHCGTKLNCGDTTVLSGENSPWRQNETDQETAPAAPVNQPVNQPYLGQSPVSPNPGYAPNCGYPANQGFVPNQGYNPGSQSYGTYAVPPQALGNTPARQLVRKLATSPAFLTGVLAVTLAFLLALVRGISTISVGVEILNSYRSSEIRTQIISTIIGTGFGILLSAIFAVALWVTFGSALSRRNERMCTGGLTTLKVFAVIGIVVASLSILAVVFLGIMMLIYKPSFSDLDDFFEMFAWYGSLGNRPSLLNRLSLSGLLVILYVTVFAVLILLLIFMIKLVKTINTGKRVIINGWPDDRVSIYVVVMVIIGLVGTVLSALNTLVRGATTAAVLNGVSALLTAVSSICFLTVLLKFRSGMRQLGVWKGVMQRPY